MSNQPQKKPKPKAWAEMHPGEREAILQSLKDGGFGSELRARYVFNEQGFDVRTNYFHDLDHNKTREMDAIAYRRIKNYPPGQIHHEIVAEVKSGYIWILGEKNNDLDFHPVLSHSTPRWFEEKIKTSANHPKWEALSSCVYGEHLESQGIYTSIHHRAEKDVWYESAEKVFKASKFNPASNSFLNTDFVVGIPLVILDGNLLAATFGPDGELALEPKDHVQVLFSYASERYKRKEIAIHVVTLDGLPGFLNLVLSDGVKGSELGVELYKSLSETEKNPGPKLVL